jgi:hypothetical protein
MHLRTNTLIEMFGPGHIVTWTASETFKIAPPRTAIMRKAVFRSHNLLEHCEAKQDYLLRISHL